MHLVLLISICLIEIVENRNSLENSVRNKRKAILMGIAIFLFAALRGRTVGIDIPSYFADFYLVQYRSFTEIVAMNYRDPAFPIFMKLLSYISSDPQIMLVVIAAFEAICFSYLAYSFGNPFLLFILFITLRIYPFTLSGIRQTIAMSFVWLGIPVLKEKKYVKYAVIVWIGSLFHASAIVSILLIPIFLLNRTFTVSFVAIGIGIFQSLFPSTLQNSLNSILFSGRFSGYIQKAAESEFSLSTTFILYVFFYAMFVYAYKRVTKNDYYTPFYFRAASIGIAFSIIAQGFPNMFRISYYFIIFLLAKIEDILGVLFSDNSRKIAIWAVTVLLIAQYIVLGPGAGINQYQFCWQG